MGENYIKQEFDGIYNKANWQEFNDAIQQFIDPLSLREFRGYVDSQIIDDYTRSHWKSSSTKQGFGDTIVSEAEKTWLKFKIRLRDSSDKKRFLEISIDCKERKIDFIVSLDNKEKADFVYKTLIHPFTGLKVAKRRIHIDFLKRYWFIISFVFFLLIFSSQLNWSKTFSLKHWIEQEWGLVFKNSSEETEPSNSPIQNSSGVNAVQITSFGNNSSITQIENQNNYYESKDSRTFKPLDPDMLDRAEAVAVTDDIKQLSVGVVLLSHGRSDHLWAQQVSDIFKRMGIKAAIGSSTDQIIGEKGIAIAINNIKKKDLIDEFLRHYEYLFSAKNGKVQILLTSVEQKEDPNYFPNMYVGKDYDLYIIVRSPLYFDEKGRAYAED